jgi:branched-chain amino acid transport system permease protein
MAQGSFVMLGALFVYTMLNEWKWPYWASIPVSIVAVIIVGVLMYELVLRPIMKVSLVAMILATIGLSILFENLALLKWGGYGKGLPPFTGSTSLWLGGVAVQPHTLWIVGMTLAVLAALHLLSNYTRLGKQMTATATRPTAASLCGISTGKMVVVAFAISAAVGALGGIGIAAIIPVAYVSGGLFGLNGFVAAILGGWGSSVGAVIGGFTLGIMEALATGLVPAGYKNAVAFVLLLLILYFRPSGLLGTQNAEGEL